MERKDIKQKVLENGVRVVYVERPSELLHARFVFNVGSVNEDDSNRGVSHLLEHLYFGANKVRSAREFQLALRSLGAQVNASTDNFNTRYFFETIAKYFMDTFNLYLDQFKNFYLTETLLEKEKEVVCQEADMQMDEPHYVCLYNLLQSSFVAHPCAIPVVGYSSIIKALTVEDVTRYHDTYYVAGNLTCILVGTFSVDMQNMIEEGLNSFTPGEPTERFLPTEDMIATYQKSSKFFKSGLTQNIVKALLPVKISSVPEILLSAMILGQGLGW